MRGERDTGRDRTGGQEGRRTGQERTGQDRTSQDKPRKDRTGQDRTVQVRKGWDRTGQDKSKQGMQGNQTENKGENTDRAATAAAAA